MLQCRVRSASKRSALAEWDVNGKHKTHGFGNQEPTVRDLVGNTFQLLGISDSQ
jgi:hypothetical protein